ncbi:efflux RND transporter permease subunit [Thalassotalea sp. HSM 43]|uniref:efflux RND transporter permease subunit n=1 Tax=Thalassotalea sp. HSM 43 TaxID=2552945 RepID=UPI0010817165|nr:efflux RND transporter permease subunit [Thalassotalea sp. HSM 43]QBY04858.1 efflux RND transporter permease subunit [Thalassotalea sp. HSM 43]
MEQQEKLTGIIAWFARNSVAANLMMVFIIIMGIYSYFNITKKMFPEFSPNTIMVTVTHLGASPADVEQSVILQIEEKLENVQGLKRVTSEATEGLATVTIEINSGYSLEDKLNEIQMQIDTITTFPAQIERPLVMKQEFQMDVLWVSVNGQMDRRTRQELAQDIKDEITALPDVNIAEVVGIRDYEISIEISELQLLEYGLTFDEISQAIKRSSLDLPGGTIKSSGGYIQLRTEGQAYTGQEFSRLVLRTNSDGTHLTLGDIANVKDAFVEDEGFALFDGKNTTSIRVRSTSNQNDLEIAKQVRAYVDKKQQSLPEGANVEVFADSSFYLSERLTMMFENLMLGAALVFLVLTLFLRVRVAFWVMVGIPICFLGAFMMMPLLGDFSVTVNLLSLFAFIMVLGIVVDDAIVIGESVYSEVQNKGHSVDNVIRGAHRVAMPATFGVLTTIAAFAPLIFIDTNFSGFFQSIAIVVMLCLVFSIIESKWILPAHLAHMKYTEIDPDNAHIVHRIQLRFKAWLDIFIKNTYLRSITWSLKNRYTTMAAFIALFFLSIGLIAGSLVKTEVFPSVPSDFIQGQIIMEDGMAPERRNEALQRVIDSGYEMAEENLYQGESFIRHIMVFTNGNLAGGFLMELNKSEFRELNAFEIEKLWREQIGEIPGVKELRLFAGTNAGGGAALEFQLNGLDEYELEQAALEVQDKLGEYDGVYDIRNSFSRGSEEIKLSIRPEAEVLGLSLSDLGKQVRQAFYGDEAQRIQRGRNEVKVMVRYPEEERRSITDLENMWVRTPSGQEVPFYQVADVEIGQGFSKITRINNKRTIKIAAEIDSEKVESRKVLGEFNEQIIPAILAKYPTVKYGMEGASKDQQDFLQQLMFAAVTALFLIYGLIAIPTKSYTQPLVIMSVIPFGIIGAIWGHMIVGKTINMMSMYGFIALSGVVVNDSLILVDFINRAKNTGMRMMDIVIEAGMQRFRAILLTSLTTFFGILPIYFETSLQAQFIIPMAISLGFGIIFATVITLFLIPSLYLIREDIGNQFKRKRQPSNLTHG